MNNIWVRLLFHFLLSLIPLFIALRKDRPAWVFFLLSLLLTPPVGIIAALCVTDLNKVTVAPPPVTKECKRCGHRGASHDTSCPLCGGPFRTVEDPDYVAPPAPKPPLFGKIRLVLCLGLSVIALLCVLMGPTILGDLNFKKGNYASAEFWYSMYPFTGEEMKRAALEEGRRLRKEGKLSDAFDYFQKAGELGIQESKHICLEYALELDGSGEYFDAVLWLKRSEEVGRETWLQLALAHATQALTEERYGAAAEFIDRIPPAADTEFLLSQAYVDAIRSAAGSNETERILALLSEMPEARTPEQTQAIDKLCLDQCLKQLRLALESDDVMASDGEPFQTALMLARCCTADPDALDVLRLLETWPTSKLTDTVCSLERLHSRRLGNLDWALMARTVLDRKGFILTGTPELMALHYRVQAMTVPHIPSYDQLQETLTAITEDDPGSFAEPRDGHREELAVSSYRDILSMMVPSQDSGKILIVRSVKDLDGDTVFMTDLDLMTLLPQRFYPESIDKAQYLVLLEYDLLYEGTYYSCSTKAYRQQLKISCYQSNGQRLYSLDSQLSGGYPPAMITYYGSPPEYATGGAPDLSFALPIPLAYLMSVYS